MNLYVSNLGNQITDESLRAIFATHGEVRSSKIVRDGFTGYARDFAYVEMPNDREAERAILKINNRVINGQTISVKEVRSIRPEQTFIDR